MFRVAPIRVSMWRAGWVMLAFSLIASLVAISTDRLASARFALAALSNDRSGALVIAYTGILLSGWLSANGEWSKWRRGALARTVAVAREPTTDAVLTWTMKHLVVGTLFLVVGIGLAPVIAGPGDGEFRMILPVAVGLGTIAVENLILAWRVGKLERVHGVVYYWQRQPGVRSIVKAPVYAVPAYAAS